MDPVIRKIFPEFCFMEVLKRKGEGKFQLDGGCQAKASYGLYALFVKQGEGLVASLQDKT